MTVVTVVGASDDLIEIDSQPRTDALYDEIDCYDQPTYVAFDDGTVLHVEFTDAWHIRPVHIPDDDEAIGYVLTIRPTGEDDEVDDVARIDSPVITSWVSHDASPWPGLDAARAEWAKIAAAART